MATAREILADQAHQTDENEARAKIRQHVLDAATHGRHTNIHRDDVLAAFADHPDEFDEYRRRLKAAREEQAKRQKAADARVELAAETRRVLKEWDDKRHAEAEAEARRRLTGQKGKAA